MANLLRVDDEVGEGLLAASVLGFEVKKWVPEASPETLTDPGPTLQLGEAGTHDTVGDVPLASAATKPSNADPLLETTYGAPLIVSVGVALPSRSASLASRLARKRVSTMANSRRVTSSGARPCRDPYPGACAWDRGPAWRCLPVPHAA